MTNGFQIVTSTLLDSLVRRDRGVSGGAGEVLAIFVRNMFTLTILVALSETKVNDEDIVSSRLSATDQEVIGLDITMDDPLVVHLLNSLDQLRANKEDGFQIELPTASLEEVFKGWTKQVHNHDMEMLVGSGAISANVVQARHARYNKEQSQGSEEFLFNGYI